MTAIKPIHDGVSIDEREFEVSKVQNFITSHRHIFHLINIFCEEYYMREYEKKMRLIIFPGGKRGKFILSELKFRFNYVVLCNCM